MSESHSIEEVRAHVRVYMMIFGSLAVLTIVTVAVGYLHLPILPALIIALSIAALKGGLVAAHFMHLLTEKKMVFWLLILTAVFLFSMIVLFVSAHNDQIGAAYLHEGIRYVA